MENCCTSIQDKLLRIQEIKKLIKASIESQGVEVDDATFAEYAELITEIRKVSSVNEKQGDVIVEDIILSMDEYNSLEDTDKYTSYFISEDM